MYEFNLIVSCPWGSYGEAKNEIVKLLKEFGDNDPYIEKTYAKGVLGVKTSLDPREVIIRLRKMFENDMFSVQYTLKWIPVDVWTLSDIEAIKEKVQKLKSLILKGESWRMTVEKRRYTKYHTIDIIREVAGLIEEKVNLKNPDKVLRLDILGKYTGISVLTAHDVFSTSRLV